MCVCKRLRQKETDFMSKVCRHVKENYVGIQHIETMKNTFRASSHEWRKERECERGPEGRRREMETKE